ncbi:BatD family protein [Thioflexithrix psekupsensis]|nr:BatD family protein [Thioflexithrix psekupsensis]
MMIVIRTLYKLYFSLLLFVLFSTELLAAPTLTAHLDSPQITQDQVAFLTLTLDDPQQLANSRSSEPDLTPLRELFEVSGQQVMESTNVINNRISRQLTWSYQLAPKQSGQLTIPALSLKIGDTEIKSEPLLLQVLPADKTQAQSLRLEVTVSNDSPYLFEPIHYTMRFYHHGELREMQAVPPGDNVLIKPLTHTNKAYQQVINGENVTVSELVYLVTPLKSGEWELSPAQIIGQKIDQRSGSFGGGGFFSFNTPRPVTIRSDSVSLKVKSPAHQPWLPATKVELTQEWETPIDGELSVGLPIIRTLVLTAKGSGEQALPPLDKLMSEQANLLRVRAPNAEQNWSIPRGENHGVATLKQRFSLTPLQAGTIILPEIKVPWWNVTTDQLEWAIIPEQTLTVIENPAFVLSPAPETVNHAAPVTVQYVQQVAFNLWQYGFLSTALLALFIALVLSRLSLKPKPVKIAMSSTAVSRLDTKWLWQQFAATNDLSQLRRLLQRYICYHWRLPLTHSLSHLTQIIGQDTEAQRNVVHLIQVLDVALYGKERENLDVAQWKHELLSALAHLPVPRPTAGDQAGSPAEVLLLNPAV